MSLAIIYSCGKSKTAFGAKPQTKSSDFPLSSSLVKIEQKYLNIVQNISRFSSHVFSIAECG